MARGRPLPGPGSDLGIAGDEGPGRWVVAREGLADRVPVSLRGRALGVPAAAAVAAVSMALALACGLAVRTLMVRPHVTTVSAPSRSITEQVGAGGAGTGLRAGGPVDARPATTTLLVVDVEGRVRRPGLVRVPPGSRVADAVRAAGGPAPGAAVTRINLARPVADGEQVVVPGPGDPLPPGARDTAAADAAAGHSAAPLDLNSATQAQLDALPGIGPVLAERIVAWRTEHGRFTSVDELGEVSGIGAKAMERLRPLVRV